MPSNHKDLAVMLNYQSQKTQKQQHPCNLCNAATQAREARCILSIMPLKLILSQTYVH